MSSTITPASLGDNFGTLQQILQNAASTKQRLDQLTTQASSGYVATTYAGLSASASKIVLDLTPQIAAISNTVSNINAATGRMGVQQTALSEISRVASNVLAQIPALNSLNSQGLATIAASAQQALQQVAGLLNTQFGGIYVFAGTDSANPPIPNPGAIASSGFFTQIQSAVSGLATNGSAATIATTLAIATSNSAGTSPFSATLNTTSALPVVATGAGQTATIGIAADQNAFVASAGSSTTGSYMRDILRALSTIGSMTAPQLATPGFAGLLADTQSSLGSAVSALNQDAGVLGNTQSSLTTQATALQSTSTALSSALGAADNVDMATTLSQLSAVQTQLQASYQIIAAMKTMSLTQYL